MNADDLLEKLRAVPNETESVQMLAIRLRTSSVAVFSMARALERRGLVFIFPTAGEHSSKMVSIK